MGGLGTMLTSLIAAQAVSPSSPDPVVVLPAYSYLFNEPKLRIESLGHVEVDYRPRRFLGLVGPRIQRKVATKVFRFDWTVDVVTSSSGHQDLASPSPSPSSPSIVVPVYLVGPGDVDPFLSAFRASGPHDIYSAPPPLSQEWKDLYFLKAATNLLAEKVFPAQDGDAVVHLHGATNALATCFLRSHPGTDRQVATVYTLHDYLDEVEYSLLHLNIDTFLSLSACQSQLPPDLKPVRRTSAFASRLSVLNHNGLAWLLPAELAESTQVDNCGRYFPSHLGISLSSLASFVSHTLSTVLLNPHEFAFPSNGRVVSAVRDKNDHAGWVGVTNGVDFGGKDEGRDPFASTRLLEIGTTFLSKPGTSWQLTKRKAKRWLIEHHPDLLPPHAEAKPLILFIGRFQYNKGCELFPSLLAVLSASDSSDPTPRGHFIALGTRNNYPHSHLKALAASHPSTFTLIDDPSLQPSLGPVLRMAADFVFVPSLAESFGLVAVEGLVFGSAVIGSGVGGMKEFLRDAGEDDGNAYLFDVSAGTTENAPIDQLPSPQNGGRRPLPPAVHELVQSAVTRALDDYERRWRVEGEEAMERFVRNMVKGTEGMRWGREGGAVEQYARIYEEALRRAGQEGESEAGAKQVKEARIEKTEL